MEFVGRRARRGREKGKTSRAFEGVFIDSTTGTGAIITISNLPSTTASSHQAPPGPPNLTHLPTHMRRQSGRQGIESKQFFRKKKK